VKSPKPAFREAGKFASAAERASSRVVLGHLRAASNPRGVPKSRLINLSMTQPYTDGKWIFCHNGTLQIPDEVAKLLGPWRSKVKSLNDSEVFFWQLRKFIETHGGDVPAAMKACVRETWGLWEACKDRYPDKKSPYTGLNALVSDGKSLWALCHYPHKMGHTALFSGQTWGRMSLLRKGGRVLVASEALDPTGWDTLGAAEIVTARPSGGRIKVTRETFDPRETA
ncbi:MAG: hypothetical protein HY925_09520, partial [Elusimicrobia bacterium]|nr:hypothetical protein [Elusimicrobiota bacterium]